MERHDFRSVAGEIPGALSTRIAGPGKRAGAIDGAELT